MKVLIGVLLSLTMANIGMADASTNVDFLVDDFTSPEGKSKIGSYWQLFSDTVMGGVSKGTAFLVPSSNSEGQYVLRMRGQVSLENNGGFIQVRLPLTIGRKPFDASSFKGLSLRVKGNGEKYYIHARTTGTAMPWAYFYQKFEASEEWSTVTLAFDSFEGENTVRNVLPADRLVSIAVVAAKEEMAADISISEISFYK